MAIRLISNKYDEGEPLDVDTSELRELAIKHGVSIEYVATELSYIYEAVAITNDTDMHLVVEDIE